MVIQVNFTSSTIILTNGVIAYTKCYLLWVILSHTISQTMGNILDLDMQEDLELKIRNITKCLKWHVAALL